MKLILRVTNYTSSERVLQVINPPVGVPAKGSVDIDLSQTATQFHKPEFLSEFAACIENKLLGAVILSDIITPSMLPCEPAAPVQEAPAVVQEAPADEEKAVDKNKGMATTVAGTKQSPEDTEDEDNLIPEAGMGTTELGDEGPRKGISTTVAERKNKSAMDSRVAFDVPEGITTPEVAAAVREAEAADKAEAEAAEAEAAAKAESEAAAKAEAEAEAAAKAEAESEAAEAAAKAESEAAEAKQAKKTTRRRSKKS